MIFKKSKKNRNFLVPEMLDFEHFRWIEMDVDIFLFLGEGIIVVEPGGK